MALILMPGAGATKAENVQPIPSPPLEEEGLRIGIIMEIQERLHLSSNLHLRLNNRS